ncbi:MAG: hypothetical protein DSY46_08130 [Hydrogenimonas sp.]|nr:MAG: hypothetical protein DSY46_08130 [Hydrogenimonas sp.]
MRSNWRQILFLGISTITATTLLTGCGKKPIPHPVANEAYKTDAKLYAPYDLKNETFKKEIRNDAKEPSVCLNNYLPVGFNTRVYEVDEIGILWNRPETPEVPFEVVECEDKPSQVFLINTLFAPFVLGLNIVLGGGTCTHRHAFNYELFDETVKDWIESEGIDRIALIDGYDGLLKKEHQAEAHLKHLTDETNSELNQMLTNYQTRYQTKMPKVTVRYEDYSGFYNNESLETLVTLKHKSLEHHPVDFTKDYSSFVNTAFPCQPNAECLQKFSDLKVAIDEDLQKRSEEIKQTKKVEAKRAYEAYLKQRTAKIDVIPNYDEHAFKKEHKTLFYRLKKMPEEVDSNAKNIMATYQIVAASFKDVFPAYHNADRNIEIEFEPETQTIVLTNKTDQFLEIGSISLYYNDAIYKLANDKTQNFINELSPHAVTRLKALTLWETIKEASFERVTTDMTRGKSLNFGLAIKYATLQPYQKHTLYRLDRHDLTQFLKQF